MALEYVQALVKRVAMGGRPTDAGSADLLDKAEVSIGKKAAGQRHPEIVDQPEPRTIFVRKNVRTNRFVHISFLNQSGPRGAAMVANILPILADFDLLSEPR